MPSNRKNNLQVFFYKKVLDLTGSLLPKSFFGEKIEKKSFAFISYVLILDFYISILEKIDKKNSDFLKELQNERLKSIVKTANKTLWWNNYFKDNQIDPHNINRLEDFKKIPSVTRATLLYAERKNLVNEVNEKAILWRRSGGSSTGIPFEWGHSKSFFYVNISSRFIKEMIQRGFDFNSYKFKNFYVQFNFPHRLPASPFRWFMKNDYYISTTDKDYEFQIKRMSKDIVDMNGCILRTSPIELNFLIGQLENQDLHPPILFCLIVGSFLSEDIRNRAQKYLNCPVITHYGSQEIGPFSLECKENPGIYHIFPERVYVETLDGNDNTVPSGDIGDITVTSLDNTTMPLIRYKLGDIGVIHDNLSCSCHNRSMAIEPKNRETDFIVNSQNKRMPVRLIFNKLDREPFVSKLRRYQIRQEKDSSLTVLLETQISIDQKIVDALHNFIKKSYENMEVQIIQVANIKQESPKFKVFVPFKKNGG